MIPCLLRIFAKNESKKRLHENSLYLHLYSPKNWENLCSLSGYHLLKNPALLWYVSGLFLFWEQNRCNGKTSTRSNQAESTFGLDF